MANKPKKVDSTSNSDPHNVNGRLYDQIALLLDDMEGMDRDDTMTFPQRLNAIIAIGRVQIMFANLRKAEARDPGSAGSKVRTYANAFRQTANAASRRTGGRGAANIVELDTGSDPDDGDPFPAA